MMLFLLVLYVTTCQMAPGLTQVLSDSSIHCREPVNVMDMYRNLQSSNLEEAGLSQDEWVPAASYRQDVVSDYYDVTITALNRTCHHMRHLQTCTCQGRQELNYDANRIPKALVQTSCCSRNQQFTSRWLTECRQIYHKVRVLRRWGCSEGIYQYRAQWERIPIGCSCHVMERPVSAL